MANEQTNFVARVFADPACRDMWPSAPTRPVVSIAATPDGNIKRVTLQVIPAARDFVRSRLLRYRATGTGGRDLWDRAMWDESTGSVTFENIDQSRVREQLDSYLAGLEDGFALAMGTISSHKNVADVYTEAKRLPWGKTGDPETEAPLVDFVRSVLACDTKGGGTVTSDELLCLYAKVCGDDPGDNWARRRDLLRDLGEAVEHAFKHEKGVSYSAGNIRRTASVKGDYHRTTRHRGWVGLKITGSYQFIAARVHHDG